MSNGPMEAISPFVLRAMACDIEEMQSPQAWADRCRAAAAEIEKLRAENERLTNNARSDARLLAAYHKWCDMQGCAPSSSDLSKARAALGEKE